MGTELRQERLRKFIDENPEVCREALKADLELKARGLDLQEALQNVLTILRKGGTQEQAHAYAKDYGEGKAKPIEAYL